LAAQRGSAAQIAAIQAAHRAMSLADSPGTHDRAFHGAIAEACGNAALASAISHIRQLSTASPVFSRPEEHFAATQVSQAAHPDGRATPCTITWSASWRACEKISAAAACASCRHPARKAPRQQHPKVKTMQLTRTLTALLATAGIALAAPAQALDIKLGHVLAPSHSWHKAAEGFAADVKEKTEGRVNFVLYPSGQLGNEKTMIEGLQIGSQGAAIIGSGSLQPVEPKFGIVELPYTWKDARQAYA